MNAALAKISAPAKSPLPPEVDTAAEEFGHLHKDLADAREKLKTATNNAVDRELALIEWVRSHGGPHATKSKILHGILWEMVATFSQYTTQDSAAVERLRLALVKAKQTRLLKKIFTSDTRWTMKSAAAEIVKTEKLAPKLMALLLMCTVTADKKPSLDVRLKKKPAQPAS
jgi:hypothetical protein